jgi:hypothetical protein
MACWSGGGEPHSAEHGFVKSDSLIETLLSRLSCPMLSRMPRLPLTSFTQLWLSNLSTGRANTALKVQFSHGLVVPMTAFACTGNSPRSRGGCLTGSITVWFTLRRLAVRDYTSHSPAHVRGLRVWTSSSVLPFPTCKPGVM